MATARQVDPAQQMEELLKCPLCLETLKEPRTLGCLHSFCEHCLATYVEIQRDEDPLGKARHLFHCPLCRTQFELGEGESVERLPKNHFVNNLLEILAIQQQTLKFFCESCDIQVAAESRCIECEQFLCKNCLKTHSNCPEYKNHAVMTLEELKKPENQAKARGKPRCKKNGHGNKHLEMYCNTCQKLACISCIILDHPKDNHDYQTVELVATQRKEALKYTSAILQKKSEQGQNTLKKIEQASAVAIDSAKKSKDIILEQEREILKEFTAKLKHKTAALLEEVDKNYNNVNQKLVKQKKRMKGYVDKVNGFLDVAQNMIEKGSGAEILSLGENIEENRKTIEKECPKLMRPVHTGDFEYLPSKSSKRIVETFNLSDFGGIVNARGQLLCESSAILGGKIDHAKQLCHWMEDERFRWKLCYRASQDGWSAEDFHRKCDEVGPTVTLVKCGTNIFGGYTDQSWEVTELTVGLPFVGACYKYSNASFLFSLQNEEGLPPIKCPINGHQKGTAIFCGSWCGSSFGVIDLHISNNANTNQRSCSNLGRTYESPPGYQPDKSQAHTLLAGSFHFQPTEIEVFHR